jgi:hypothetical protein
MSGSFDRRLARPEGTERAVQTLSIEGVGKLIDRLSAA